MGKLWSGLVCALFSFSKMLPSRSLRMSWHLVINLRCDMILQGNSTLLTISIVIVLIAAEILVAAINIVVDLYAGVD